MHSRDRIHLSDAELIETYFAHAGKTTNAGSEIATEHVRSCEACRDRLAELTGSLEALRQEALAEADAYFTDERLAAQHTQITRRLERAEHPAVVVPFPEARACSGRAAPPRPAFRWVAAAAAAGLLVGVTAGRLLPGWSAGSARPPAVEQQAARQARSAADVATHPAGTQQAKSPARPELEGDVLLIEVENAVTRQNIAALKALDAMTPNARDVAARGK